MIADYLVFLFTNEIDSNLFTVLMFSLISMEHCFVQGNLNVFGAFSGDTFLKSLNIGIKIENESPSLSKVNGG